MREQGGIIKVREGKGGNWDKILAGVGIEGAMLRRARMIYL